MHGSHNAYYIDGAWHDALGERVIPIHAPDSGKLRTTIPIATAAEVDQACRAAARRFPAAAAEPLDQRLHRLRRLTDLYRDAMPEIGALISAEIGAPLRYATTKQVESGLRQLQSTIKCALEFNWSSRVSSKNITIRQVPVGVCALLTPWNWPMNQLLAKLAPAMAAGCTVVIKPSELCVDSTRLVIALTEAAGYPPGQINLVTGDATTGAALCEHRIPRLVSFTGSTRTGKAVAREAAASFKYVTLELGGKSPAIVFADYPLDKAVKRTIRGCFHHSGQSCNAPTRLLIERSVYADALSLAREYAARFVPGSPSDVTTRIGPVASAAQYHRIQKLLEAAVSEDCRILSGGPGPPDGLPVGYYVRPTVIADVSPRSPLARDEIFGPVLCLLPFDDEEDAIRLANDSDYGLAAFVYSGNHARARRVACRLEAGMVHINGAGFSSQAPFGGLKQSGLGREYGEYGLRQFTETQAIADREQ